MGGVHGFDVYAYKVRHSWDDWGLLLKELKHVTTGSYLMKKYHTSQTGYVGNV